MALVGSGDPESALVHIDRAIEVHRSAFPEGHVRWATLRLSRADILIVLDRLDDAEAEVQLAREYGERFGGSAHFSLGRGEERSARIAELCGR